ncbi:glycine zipper 2TM domain-containing protein [Lacisediminimonas sp.]|uniref:glycine zipper 2TM domain-containing protein n=1 Tax=Lacisediminimonas sp. TaxID=3060582 RepID=UPI00271F7A83|nr:glycine zipper 2TM domain-containing protein [Lacisediminimonas sp.]MDO8301046.1 glycine zipper 2TM domain-containing protein [Lacisediminimonas sp.]MDO9217898.1 glycine zipper 2TM domain-containing protein [Lacisediminimonas sp.]
MHNALGNEQKPRTHPAVIVAGVAVVLFCTIGAAAILGWIPSSLSGNQPATPVAASAPAASSAPRVAAKAVAKPAAEPVRQAQGSNQSTYAANVPAVANCAACGVVESTREFSTRGSGSGLGAAGGAVVGGLLGNQVGGGRGQDVMTVVGALGGAVAGNQIEGKMKSTQGYEIVVRLNDGSVRTVQQTTRPEWRAGDNVRIVDGVVRSNG